jgi:hypothetical protein
VHVDVFYFTDIYHEVVKKCQELEVLLNQNSFQPSVPVGDSLRYYNALLASLVLV